MYHFKLSLFVVFAAGMLTLGTVSEHGSSAESSHNRRLEKADCAPREKIVFTRADPANPFETAEIHLMNPDGSESLQLTYDAVADALPSLSSGAKGKIVFDSNRTAVALGAPVTTTNSDLFLMNADGTADSDLFPTPLTRGSSASWSADGKLIAFHRSQSGNYGTRIPGRTEPGGPTRDSDIFVVNLDDLLANGEQPTNITENFEGQTPGVKSSDDDADWSPEGSKIAFTSRNSACATVATCQAAAEIWVMNADGTNPQQLTFNSLEERSPDWSPDGTKIMYMCRPGPGMPFEICVMNADGTGREVLTANDVPDLGPTWSPDGMRIVFQRIVAGQQQIYVMNYLADENGSRNEAALTALPTINLFPNWGTVAVGCGEL